MIAILTILAILLIISLLLSDVEGKTFEYGMLRTLGLNQGDLIGLLMMQVRCGCCQTLYVHSLRRPISYPQALHFSIPGIFIGLLVSFLLFVPLAYFLSIFATEKIDVTMNTLSIVLGVVAGILLPVVVQTKCFISLLGNRDPVSPISHQDDPRCFGYLPQCSF